MNSEKQCVKSSIDWELVEDRAGTFLAYCLFVVGAGLLGLFVVCLMAIFVLLGICLTVQGWWGVGIPVMVAGIVLDIAALVFLFAKLMVRIKERVAR